MCPFVLAKQLKHNYNQVGLNSGPSGLPGPGPPCARPALALATQVEQLHFNMYDYVRVGRVGSAKARRRAAARSRADEELASRGRIDVG